MSENVDRLFSSVPRPLAMNQIADDDAVTADLSYAATKFETSYSGSGRKRKSRADREQAAEGSGRPYA
jgi:hypothetical protein